MAVGERAAAPGWGSLDRLFPGVADHPADWRSHRDAIDPGRVRRRLAACPELDCIRHRLPPGTLAAAELRSAEIGMGADRILVAAQVISDDDYAAALAHALGTVFETLDTTTRADCPLDDERLIEAAAAGMLPLGSGGQRALAIAPQIYGARQLIAFLARNPHVAGRVRVTTRACIENFIMRHASHVIGRRAAFALNTSRPQFSAAQPGSRLLLVLIAALCIAGGILIPDAMQLGIDILLAFIFLSWIGLRLLGALTTGLLWRRDVALRDETLPVYTIIVALYREVAALRGLIRSLAALDYPAEKLDIKLVIEPDDFDMHAALANLRLGPPFEIIVAPPVGPRTKPKALNAALPFARGQFIAVYDAEDRPESDQLRRALQAFSTDSERLACVQGRLTIDNAADSWLTRLFTAEYAGLFDVFLPGIAAWRLPLPLGGSSNHFRTAVLRRVGAWDPFNVTEDADLGMRLSRLGYRTTVIDSATYEEAPSRFGPWLRQRTRWFKGWMQTWLVHMRHPLALLHDLGVAGFAVFQLVVGGTVLAALVHSLFAAALIWQVASGGLIGRADAVSELVIAGLHGTTLVSGYVISALIALIGLARRNLLNCAWSLVLMPFYWILLSIAAWRALFQLMHDPYRWEKTEHGRARTSRLARAQAARSRRA